MNFIYFFKEIYIKLYQTIIIFFFTTTIFFVFPFSNYLFIQLNTANKYISFIPIKLTSLQKWKWSPDFKENIIYHIEYFTIETITYKLIMCFFFFLLLFSFFFFFFQWKITISFPHEKKKYLLFFYIFCLYYTYHFTSFSFNLQNNKIYMGLHEKTFYYNIYCEPQITMESLLDSFLFLIFFFFMKCFIIFYSFNKKPILRLFLFFLFFFLFHFDFFYFLFSFFEIEFCIFLLKWVFLYTGDDRN